MKVQFIFNYSSPLQIKFCTNANAKLIWILHAVYTPGDVKPDLELTYGNEFNNKTQLLTTDNWMQQMVTFRH